MVEPLRHRQTKGAATDMFDLKPPRHISTLHERAMAASHLVSPQFEAKRLCAGRSQMVFTPTQRNLVRALVLKLVQRRV
jgi:hypothetical protein